MGSLTRTFGVLALLAGATSWYLIHSATGKTWSPRLSDRKQMAINTTGLLSPRPIAVKATSLEATASLQETVRPVSSAAVTPPLITPEAKAEHAEQVFFTEDRDRYWAGNSESSLSAALDAVPGRPNFDVTVECHTTFCRIAAQGFPEIMSLVGTDADWEAELKDVLKHPPQNDMFDGQVTTLHVDISSGVVTIVSFLHRHTTTD